MKIRNIVTVLLFSAPFFSSQGYDNKIADISPRNDYVEICFKDGNTFTDAHNGGENTAGGNCLPGDVGFIIEKKQRNKANWTMAKKSCLEDGMDIPTPFEWQLSCYHAKEWSLENMTGDGWEWAASEGSPQVVFNKAGIGGAIFGYSGCHYASWEWIAYYSGGSYEAAFRCVR